MSENLYCQFELRDCLTEANIAIIAHILNLLLLTMALKTAVITSVISSAHIFPIDSNDNQRAHYRMAIMM